MGVRTSDGKRWRHPLFSTRRRRQRSDVESTRMVTPQSPKPTVYIETTIVGYLTARPIKDVVVTGNMALTRELNEVQS
jgi:hypothetical protein